VFGADNRMVVTPPFFRTVSAASARPSEYGSWKSKRTTFFTCSLSIMNLASLGPWM